MVDSFEDVVYVVVHSSHSDKLFCCGGAGEFVVMVEVYDVRIKRIKTSVWGELIGSGCCGVVGKFWER